VLKSDDYAKIHDQIVSLMNIGKINWKTPPLLKRIAAEACITIWHLLEAS